MMIVKVDEEVYWELLGAMRREREDSDAEDYPAHHALVVRAIRQLEAAKPAV